jgi:hypothetical protein
MKFDGSNQKVFPDAWDAGDPSIEVTSEMIEAGRAAADLISYLAV